MGTLEAEFAQAGRDHEVRLIQAEIRLRNMRIERAEANGDSALHDLQVLGQLRRRLAQIGGNGVDV